MFLEKTKPPTQPRNLSTFRTKQRLPNKLQWQMLKKLQANSMELETFLQRWKVNHKELAQICFCSVDTVDGWFVESKNRKPTLHHKFFLGLTNKLWTDLLMREEH